MKQRQLVYGTLLATKGDLRLWASGYVTQGSEEDND